MPAKVQAKLKPSNAAQPGTSGKSGTTDLKKPKDKSTNQKEPRQSTSSPKGITPISDKSSNKKPRLSSSSGKERASISEKRLSSSPGKERTSISEKSEKRLSSSFGKERASVSGKSEKSRQSSSSARDGTSISDKPSKKSDKDGDVLEDNETIEAQEGAEVGKEKRRSKSSRKSTDSTKGQDAKRVSIPAELDDEKTTEKAKVLKNFLEKKYKVEFPAVNACVSNTELPDPTCGKSSNKGKLTKAELAEEVDNNIDLSPEEHMMLMKVYDLLEEGIEQAEEFFKSIGIEWSSSHQMFKVKPKKFLPAMTMIAFGPDYDDVIVCKDDEETGETQACRLSKGNKDCPKDVTAVELNVYKDGFQAEDESFYAYSSESIKEFFMNNIGSYVIMKPNDEVPQTILIRVIDERDRSFDDVQKEKAEGKLRTKKAKQKIPKRKSRKILRDDDDSLDDVEQSKPKYYMPMNGTPTPRPPSMQKSQTETIEIFDHHKIIKRLEDVEVVQEGTMGSSSWYWKNQRKPESSEYAVPPNFSSQSTSMPNRTPSTVRSSQYDVIEKHEKATSVSDSLVNSIKNKDFQLLPTMSQVIKEEPQQPKQQQPQPQEHQIQKAPSDAKINKINIYHGPVTVINVGDGSDDSIRVKSKPGMNNRAKVQMQRTLKLKNQFPLEDDTFSKDWDNFVQNFDDDNVHTVPQGGQPRKFSGRESKIHFDDTWNLPDYRYKRTDETASDIFFPPMDPNYDMYETEYDHEYNQAAYKMMNYFDNAERRRSSGGANTENIGEYVKYQNITIFGQSPPPGEDEEIFGGGIDIEKRSVLLDLGGNSGRPNDKDNVDGIELNKKTSNTQITVSLKDNQSGKKYLVNIYPEEQLKRIWSILKLNNININNVTPELVLGNPELTKGLKSKFDGKTDDILSQISAKTVSKQSSVISKNTKKDDSDDNEDSLKNDKAPSIGSDDS